jgi:RNA polymerase sigma-70 factor (ECF subfamily)
MNELDPFVAELQETRRRFLELVADIRPDLHRYCARMTGSIADGEDIVQETLARAYYILSELGTMPPLRPWLFRIAHTRSIDYLRRYERRMAQPLDTIEDTAVDDTPDPSEALAREEAVKAAMSTFAALVPLQRSCVILKDVLGSSLDDIAQLLDVTIPAVKAALHRGRKRLQEIAAESRVNTDPARALNGARSSAAAAGREPSAIVARYVKLFNARDWDGVRAMLADDVRLDLISRAQGSGPREVGGYFSNYAKLNDWRCAPAWLQGREVIAFFRHAADRKPGYFIEVTGVADQVTAIRDYRYVPYIAYEADFELQQ